MILGQRIKFFREQLGLTQVQLAENAGISSKAIGRYELGKRTPPVDIANSIARALGISLNELLNPEAINENPDGIKVKIPVDIFNLNLEELQAKLDARSAKLEIVIKQFDKLNEAGQQELIDYVTALTRMTKYRLDKNEREKTSHHQKKQLFSILDREGDDD
ncbi:MAG: helix-turn-helix domain-containing protein [Defluviitaleaceae bacterium]|nr:helix-turn-helix domain-containing protein [Defluviitaleaceae bacterium]